MAAAAGWYPDGQNPGNERFWDGSVWTEQRRPIPAGTSQRDIKRATKDMARQQKADEAAAKAFAESPQGQARLAFERGDVIFQMSMTLRQQTAWIVPMVGAGSLRNEKDWTAELNDVVREGWDLLSGSVVFVQTKQESRDKFMASGQNVAIGGDVRGYYLFKRAEGNRRPR